jgi:hypothetical protein
MFYATLAIIIPVLLFVAVCASYLLYLLPAPRDEERVTPTVH